MQIRSWLMCLAVFVATVAVWSAYAQNPPPFDHLKCYKIKDARQFTVKGYNADLIPEQKPLFSDENCLIKMPAKLFCIDVQKTNVNPTPPGAPPGPDAADYLCYKFKGKCTTGGLAKSFSVDVTDQFGAGTIWVKKPGLLCAPAIKNVTTTTTSTTTTTTTTLPGLCQDTVPPQCGGVCPNPLFGCEAVTDQNGLLVCDCPCSDDGTGTGCDGFCPNAGEICVPGGAAGCHCARDCKLEPPLECVLGLCPAGLSCQLDVPNNVCACMP